MRNRTRNLTLLTLIPVILVAALPAAAQTLDLEFYWEACATDPALVGVHFRPDGKLWVERCPLTADPEAGDFGAFDEFDREGRLLRRVHLRAPGDSATDRLVALSDGRFVLMRNHHVAADSEAEDVELEVVLLR